ncbi:MAG: Lrp/AsnC family transcriptional regulator [Gammaproteobacteria bacterium]
MQPLWSLSLSIETKNTCATIQSDETKTNPELSALEKQLLNDFQRDFPLSPTPFAEIAKRLNSTSHTILQRLRELHESGVVSRVGPVLRPNKIGASTLAAMAVPQDRLPKVAELVNNYSEVNHNYEREHRLNLWFVVTAADKAQLDAVLREIEQQTNLSVLRLPLLDDYHIDLGFELQWNC